MPVYQLETVNKYIEACWLNQAQGAYLMSLDQSAQQRFLVCLSKEALDHAYTRLDAIKMGATGHQMQVHYVEKHREDYKECVAARVKLDPNLGDLASYSSINCQEVMHDYKKSQLKGKSCPDRIDISNLDKAEVLVALYNNAWEGFAINAPKKLSIEKARELLRQDPDFDYLGGRELKVNLGEDIMYVGLYDRAAGYCAAYNAIKPLLGEQGLSVGAEDL
jgi:hypothetical protein